MPDDASTISTPENNILNAALALVRAKKKALGPAYALYLRALNKADPDLARMFHAAGKLDDLRQQAKRVTS